MSGAVQKMQAIAIQIHQDSAHRSKHKRPDKLPVWKPRDTLQLRDMVARLRHQGMNIVESPREADFTQATSFLRMRLQKLVRPLVVGPLRTVLVDLRPSREQAAACILAAQASGIQLAQSEMFSFAVDSGFMELTEPQ
ncbi:hypothetical protein N2152v2_008226 [Parachlorella kessleri]